MDTLYAAFTHFSLLTSHFAHSSRQNPPRPRRFHHPRHGNIHSRFPHDLAVRGGAVEDLIEALTHSIGQTRLDLLYRHLLPLSLLGVFQEGDEDATGVAENVGDDQHFALVQNGIRAGRGRGVGPFGDDLRSDPRGVLVGNL